MLSGLNHLTLAVSQLAPSVAFYQQLLGMTLHARWDSGAYLSCGDLWLCLSLDPQRRITPSEESDYTHYAFSIMWGGDRFCMRGSLPRKTCEALRDKALGRTSRICTAGRKMRFYYDLCDEFCTITDC